MKLCSSARVLTSPACSLPGNKDPKPCNLAHETSKVSLVTPSELPNLPATAMMNNGKKDTSNADVQKLQEQLNDIKEQVKERDRLRECLKNLVEFWGKVAFSVHIR